MANCCLKKPSKRITFRKKFKLQRKVREHSKKLKKVDKHSRRKGRKNEKPIFVPNKCPFKENLINEFKTKQKQLKEEIKDKKLQLKQISKVLKNKDEETAEEIAPIFTNLFDEDVRLESNLKRARKKLKKQRSRTNKAAEKLADNFFSSMDIN